MSRKVEYGAKLALMRGEFIEIWDVTTDRQEQALEISSCNGQPISVIFSSDGAKLMAAKKVDKADTIWVWIWNATTGQGELVFQHSREYIRKVLLFSHATRMVDCGSIIRILDVISGEQVLHFQPRDSYDDLLLSPDNTSLVMAVRMQVHLWDTKTGQRKKVTKFHVDHFYFKFLGLAFSPYGTRIAAYTNVFIFIEIVVTGQIEHALMTPGHRLDFDAFSPDGSHVISTDEALRI
ncbi:WD40 repeat-like protein [Penicillium malachiteum]|nr:WD40 repeat-like protein [Penicillium malachiteum]